MKFSVITQWRVFGFGAGIDLDDRELVIGVGPWTLLIEFRPKEAR